MATRGFRLEFIRFGLLLTMTVALISVAVRYNDHGSSRPQAALGHHAGPTSSPAAGGTSGPATSSQAPSTPPSSIPSSHQPSSSGGGNGSAGQGGGVATLPRTGSTQTVELAALALLFIAAGSFSVRISRTKPRNGHVAGSAAAVAVAHAGQAAGSSLSNRPGTG